MDEIGFQIGVERSQWIIIMSNSKRSYLITDGSRTFVTSVETISVGGTIIEPILIISGKIHIKSWYQDLRDNILIGVSDTDYINNELLYDYIYHFYHQSKKTQIGAHRILLYNGYNNYITREIFQFYKDKLIHIFFLPPHISHIL